MQRCSWCGKTQKQHGGVAFVDVEGFKKVLRMRYEERSPWTVETMRIINTLTPEIKGKAFDSDWFLLRQRFEEFEEAKNAVAKEAACPCCKAGTTLERKPCQECKGSGLAIVAYETVRTRLKLAEEQIR